ncbi:hypothetical protein [Methanobacterium congolense]|uniref:Region of a membrane-bound protein predicted to be embedded in the membrane n=1 Tax=Methanobacterium congolense TaxID=118062 RepID=A0A1D3L331_9EURY|nr:hypothetical protein [Methanobacterium congolense]SCG85963.1 Region of a membrane-bound protein predicted to be embedded in the membrane [Methanobacterium congolense]
MDLEEIPRVPLIFGLLILALVAGVAGYSYLNNDSSQQIATPAPAAQEPLTDEQMKENLENPTSEMNETADDVLDSESIDSGTVYEGTSTHSTGKKAVSAVAVVKKPNSHPTKPSKPVKPQNPTNTNPTNSNDQQNQPGQGDEGYYTDEPWDPLEPPATNPDGEGDYGGDDEFEEDNGGQGDLMP